MVQCGVQQLYSRDQLPPSLAVSSLLRMRPHAFVVWDGWRVHLPSTRQLYHLLKQCILSRPRTSNRRLLTRTLSFCSDPFFVLVALVSPTTNKPHRPTAYRTASRPMTMRAIAPGPIPLPVDAIAGDEGVGPRASHPAEDMGQAGLDTGGVGRSRHDVSTTVQQ